MMEPSTVVTGKQVDVPLRGIQAGQMGSFLRVLQELLCFFSPPKPRSKQSSPQRDFLRHFLPVLYLWLNQAAYLPLKGVEDYEGSARVWKGVLWLRLDYIAVQASMGLGCLYAVWITLGGIMALVVSCGLLLAVEKAPSHRFRQFFLLSTSVISVLIPAPVVHFLMADFLSFRGIQPGNLAFQIGSNVPALSAVSLVVYALLVLLRETAVLEALCNPKYWLPGTRSSLSAAGSDLLSLFLSSLLYLTIPTFNFYIFYGLFALLHTLLALFYYIRLPFYDENSNLVLICCHLGLAWSGIAMVLGLLMASDFTGVALIAGVTPALSYVLHSSWKSIYSQRLSSHLAVCFLPQSRNNVSLIVRSALLTNEETTIQQTFQSLRRGSPRQQSWIGVLQASYSLQVKGDERLARLQLAKNEKEKWIYWKNEYFRFKLWRFLANSTLEEITYLNFLQNVYKVESTDEALCRDLSDFWSELASHQPKRSKLNSLIDRIAVQISHSRHLYEEMLAACPDSPTLLESYTAFLRDILQKPEKSIVWETKGKIAREAQMRQGDMDLSFRQEGTAVIVVEGGKVVHCNEKAAELLQYDCFSLCNQTFGALLPPPYSNMHSGHIQRFLASNSLRHPQTLPLLTAPGFLLEVSVKVAFTCLGDNILLLLGFRKAQTHREIALLTSEGVVTSTSQGFAGMLGSPSLAVAGQLLSDLCPALLPAGEKQKIVRITPLICGTVVSDKYCAVVVRTAVLYAGTTAHIPLFTQSLGTDKQTSFLNSAEIPPPTHKVLYALEPTKHLSSNGRDALIKAKVKQGLNRAYATLGSVTVLITLMMLAWTIAIAMYLVTVTQGVIDGSVAVQLSDRIVHVTRIAGQGRFLDQTNAGFFPAYMTSDVKNVVYQSIVMLTDIEDRLWTNLESISDGKYKQLMLENLVTTWELSEGGQRSHTVNLVNAMKTYIEHSKLLLDMPLPALTIHNPSVFYLVRNGLKGELTKALALSLSLYKEIEQETIRNNVSSILFLLISVFAALGIALAITAPVILRLQLHVWKVSSIFTSLPMATYLENKRKVVDRLREKFGVEQEYGLGKHSSGLVIYRPVGVLVLLVIGFLALSAVLYLFLYFQSIDSLTTYVGHLPEDMLLYAERFAGLIDLWTWTVEAIFSTSTWPFTLAIPDDSLQLAPMQVIAITSTALKSISSQLFLLKQDGYLPFSDTHNDLFIVATNYSTPLLQKGIRPGLGIYAQDIRNCANYRGVSDAMYADCGNLYSAAKELVNVSNDVLTMLRTDFESTVLSRAWEINYWLLAWASFGLVLLVGGLLPMLYVSRRHVMRMIALGRLVPGDLGT